MTTKMESGSVCSAIPSGSNTKKRGISRLSFRRLFYTSPLINRPRISSRTKNTSSVDVRAESSSTSTSTSDKASLRQEPALQPISIINDLQSNSISTQFLKTIDAHYLECPLCLTELPIECFPEIATCSHRSCIDCLQQYLKIEITESRVNISCPECTEPLHPTDIRMILNNEILMNKYEDFMLRRVLVSEPDARWCPAPDCSFAVIASGCASCPKLKCERPGCHTYFCYHCKQEWHPNQTCDAARAQRSPNVRSSSVSFSQESAIQRDDIKPCPRCQVLIVKMDDGSCNHMTCAVCGSEFCWLCMKEISDLHYLSPSGCTFWGKKPWSRKKKILWQLGTLVGAPVGIGLVAGIAVPAMIIGIPVWVGRKLHARYEHASKHKRNLAITGGVTASILVSPILAGLAVGIGVPILLAYVYGVVPISLCRSGGCGVTTSASGVRIEFDDETDIAVGTSGHTTADAQSVDTSSHRVANPSIGEVSFGMSASLSMGSGSHLERVGLMRDSDRESASNTAIAGASLTGSVTSSMVGAPAGQRLEVQADVASNKRFSFSSETASATVSLSERSATMSLNDDASTKALAGSILGYRERDNSSTSCTPVEVHVDASGNAVGYSFINPEESVDQTKGDQASVFLNEDGYTKSSKRLKYRSSAGADKQLNAEGESGSIWSAEDTVSERVRFDENVSFIDDQPVDETAFSNSSEASSSQPILQIVNSASWPDSHLLREGTSCDMKHSDWCQAIAEHPETISEVWTENGSSVWSALAKQSGNGSRSPTPPNGHMAGTTSLTMDLSSHQGSCAVPTECKPSHSQLSLPLSTEAECSHGMSWTTHQSLPCILDTEPTLHPVMADLKQI